MPKNILKALKGLLIILAVSEYMQNSKTNNNN